MPRPSDPALDAEDADMIDKVHMLLGKAPTLRPRMLKLLDAGGNVQRVNIGTIQRWWRVVPLSGTLTPSLAIQFEGGTIMHFPDPQGQVLEAIDAAFFDVTVHDLA